MKKEKVERKRITTTLSIDHHKKLGMLTAYKGFTNKNDTIEYLLDKYWKEEFLNEMDKKND